MNLDIINSYLESHRKYHTLDHIFRMFNNMKFFDLTGDNLIKIELAILYHDIFCVPMDKHNELDSATLFMDDFINRKIIVNGKKLKRPNISSEVYIMILDTINHNPITELSKILVDLDLWDLSSYDLYGTNANLIRQEYVYGGFCSDREYESGRIQWINKMLSKDTIFHTTYCIEKGFNERAVSHLNLELNFLTK